MVNVLMKFVDGFTVGQQSFYGKEYNRATIVHVIGAEKDLVFGTEVAIIVFDVDFDHLTFSLNLKKIPVRAGDTLNIAAYANNNCYSVRRICNVPSWKGVLGNGATNAEFALKFENARLVNSVNKSTV